VYEQRENERKELVTSLRPISAVPFTRSLLWDSGHVHLFMSAYPGPKEVFCRSLGLDPQEVAWLKLGSPFDLEQRPVYRLFTGSMSHRNQKDSLPRMLSACDQILSEYAAHRGIIHCGSYRLGEIIFDHLRQTTHGHRLVFPRDAESREDGFAKHAAKEAAVIISPSMSEGYDFKDDLARFQIIAKVQWPYLVDAQVDAKRKLDPQWYDLQAVNFIIQAVGRGVRHEKDWCVSFILDSDFSMLLDRCPEFFPRWFTDAMRS
jgi:Rad3-related DNA helicase